jgi:hypothetical protein
VLEINARSPDPLLTRRLRDESRVKVAFPLLASREACGLSLVPRQCELFLDASRAL